MVEASIGPRIAALRLRRAPEVTRHNVLARDVIRRLLGRARGASACAVRALAERAGVTV